MELQELLSHGLGFEPEAQFLRESLLLSRYDIERAENRRKLRHMHPGNRFRLMVGLPLLPESGHQQPFQG